MENTDKKGLMRRGFQCGEDGVWRKLNALEHLKEGGWLEYGDRRFTGEDRVSIGNRFYKDYQISGGDGVSALDPAKIRVDGSGDMAQPEEIATAGDRFRKALRVIPVGCLEVVRQVCLEDRDITAPWEANRYQAAKEKMRQATLLCLGLDELGRFYVSLKKN